MKKLLIVGAVLGLNAAYAEISPEINPKIIYGKDDRKDFYQVSDPALRELARATAIQVYNRDISRNLNLSVNLRGENLISLFNMCTTERFAKQISAGRCSGFLVAPDVLVTAGHCVQSQLECEATSWVFDYKIDSPSTSETTNMNLASENVFRCKKVFSQMLTETGLDYAVIQLDRKATGRIPLKVRKSGKVEKKTPLLVIGHPSGLPLKFTDGGKVKRNKKDTHFEANLDTYGGNSGSAVINMNTKEVEGILVRGGTDFLYDSRMGCQVSNYCGNSMFLSESIGNITGCIGEEITRITSVPMPL